MIHNPTSSSENLPSKENALPFKKKENRIQAKKNARIIPIQSISSHPNAEILRSVHVAKLIECRAFEIEKLTETLSKADAMSKARAFQKVPRYLRRRAASHNPRKVPLKFRKQAAHELALAQSTVKKKVFIDLKKKWKQKKKTLLKLKRRILRTKIKNWIPTHVWHAKRFHMFSIWELKLPGTPTQKCARAFYRASQHGTVAFDHSYYKIYACGGTHDHLILLFSAWIPRFKWSSRWCEGWVHAQGTLVAPLRVMWMDETHVWMYVHPLAEMDVLDALGNKLKEMELKVHLEELTHLGFLSLHGPKAFGLLHSTLNVAFEIDSKTAVFWKQLQGVIDPASLPGGVALELQIWDPRLSYPPTRPSYVRSESLQSTSQTILEQPWPSFPFTLHQSQTRKVRKLSWSSLNLRRSQALIPGTPLTPNLNLDTHFPLLIVTDPVLPGLHLVVPKPYTLPLWRTLVYAGARPGGLTQHRALFQSVSPMYPFDYPETRGYFLHHTPLAALHASKWARTPPAKRVNHKAIGIHDPFLPNWKTIEPFKQWVRILLVLQSGKVNEHGVVYDLKKRVIGFVTTGEFSLNKGASTAWAVVDSRLNLKFVFFNFF
ncbi:hypothetical protein HMI54_008374 [Coelomomyces lativittatus]|nr:hypothetical protein HMI54_008374 [Coelomomyces lativittatus]